MPRRIYLCAVLALSCSATLRSGMPPSDKDLEPSPFKPPAGPIVLRDVLAELQKQTGNTIVDHRANPTNPLLTLKTGTFWETLDAIGARTGIGYSPYQGENSIALIDTPYCKLTTCHSGLFRFAVKKIAVQRNEETNTHDCQVTLSLTWEPRLAPFYVNLEKATAVFDKTSREVERQGVRGVAGAGATDIELRLPAPPRRVAKIDSLKGTLRVIAAPKLLEFAFANPASAQKAKQEGVEVRLTSVKKSASRWSIDVEVISLPGDEVPLDSYQRVAVRNSYRVRLTWVDPATKTGRTLDPVNDAPVETKQGMKIHFDFAARGDDALPPANAAVTLRYRMPSRIAAITVPFAFRDLPLP